MAMADSTSAKAALFAAIEAEVANVPKIGNVAGRAHTLVDLALAYRYTLGGPQPGVGSSGSGD
jgi:hypothetical protein